ncbi:MAG: tetratricopeptide repeat protein, partial [Nanoarchaeota archaeon]|nr:tetratricopeptide repeat protein [Nanoarchaeota archaeon]
LDKAIELNPEDGIIWCNKGRTLGEIGRYEEALESLDKAIELNPEDGVIWNNKGLTHYKLGDINGAREAFLKSLDKESKYNKRGIELCYMVQTRLRFLGEKNIGNRLLDTMGSGIIDESEARKIRKTAYQKTLKMIKK